MPFPPPPSGGSVTKVESTTGELTVATPTTTPNLSITKVPAAALTAGTGTAIATVTGKASLSTLTTPVIAKTSATGVALINGTQTILSATVPNDGKSHIVQVQSIKHVTAALTGGNITATWTVPDGTVKSLTTSGTSAIAYGLSLFQQTTINVAKPGSSVSLTQSSAMTAGAATVTGMIIIF